MSKVITFSRFFPATHKEKGKPTYFVEKFWKGLQTIGYSEPPYFFSELTGLSTVISGEDYNHATPKLHTIRSGNRFKVGDYFSPRVWSGMPYKSKQIIIAEDIKVQQIYDITFCQKDEFLQVGEYNFYPNGYEEMILKLAKNDGLTVEQFKNWFDKPFTGQIICWSNSEGVSYPQYCTQRLWLDAGGKSTPNLSD